MLSTGTPASMCGDVAVGHVLRDRAAAARVDLAHLADLPDDTLAVEYAAGIGYRLGVGVGRAALAARARVLAQAQTVVHPRGVALFVHAVEVRVIGRRHVGRQAEGDCS